MRIVTKTGWVLLFVVVAYIIILVLLKNLGEHQSRVPIQCVDITKQYIVAHYNSFTECDEGKCLKQEVRVASTLKYNMRVNDLPKGVYRDLTGYWIDEYPTIDEPEVPDAFEFQGHEQKLFATTLAVYEDDSSKLMTHQQCFNLKQQKYHLLTN